MLRTPALLAMFSKDPVSMSFAQGALRTMAILEPSLIMPAILERAYSGLESINETHRTTAVLSTLSGVALPLVSEKMWLGGQKHLLPLLELCLPGIDLVRCFGLIGLSLALTQLLSFRMTQQRLSARLCSLSRPFRISR